MTIRKIAAAALSCLMLGMTMTGCAGGAKKADPNKVYHIGVCQLVTHDALDAATTGFREALTAKLGANNVVFDEMVADGTSEKCAEICSGFVSSNCDLIMANATPAVLAAKDATSTTPIIGTSVTDYASALGISDWKGSTGMNITGTSDLAPISDQEDMLVELFPAAKTVGIVYSANETNSKYQATMFEDELVNDGLGFKEYAVTSADDLSSMVTTAVGECDVIYVPTDNMIAENADLIKSIVVPAKIPVIAGEEGICTKCGVATLSISYYDIGYAAGEMAYDILVNGKKPETMDIGFAPQVTKEYNIGISKELDISVPDGYVAIIGSAS